MYTDKDAEIVKVLLETYNVKQRASAKRYNQSPFMDYYDHITAVTDWLPYNATLSERIYCIENSIIERPLCTNCQTKTVKFEQNGHNAYRQFCSVLCGNSFKELATQRNTKVTKRRLADIVNGQNSYERNSSFRLFNQQLREIILDDGRTALDKHCTDASEKAAVINQKLYQNNEYRVCRGFLPLDQQNDFKIYSRQVRLLSEKTFRKNKNIIDQNNKRSHNYHLDHKYSVYDGFVNNIPPYILADVSNLEILPQKDNLVKYTNSSITLDELFEQVFK